MKFPHVLSSVLALSLVSAASSLAMAPPPGGTPIAPTAADAVPGEVVIQLASPSFDLKAFQEGYATTGHTGVAALDLALDDVRSNAVTPVFDLSIDPAGKHAEGMDRILLVRYAGNLTPRDAADRIAQSGAVSWAEPNYIARAALTPNDPTYPSQWAHNNTGQAIRYGGGAVGTPDCDTDTNQAWDLQTGSSSLTLAIIDTGVDTGHPEFAGRVVAGYDFANNDANPADDNGHGTSCAGIAVGAGNNSQGIAGVAWGVKLMPIKVLDASGSGAYTAVASGINWAADHGAKILSLSLGGPASSTLQTAVNYAVNTKGCAMFAASGNANASSLDYPGAYSNVIAVGALSPCNERKNPSSCDGENWWGSNYGTNLAFLAPGVRIHTTDIRGAGGFGSGDYITDFNGTSSATPHAAGVGALVWSQNASLTNSGLRTVLQSNSDDLGAAGYDTQTGYGRLNAFRAVQNAGGGGGGGTPVTLFSEGFEISVVPGSLWSAGDLNATNGSDYWGDQSSGSGARVHSGSWSAYCADNASPTGQFYDNYMNAYMTKTSAINVAGYTNVTFSFWKWHRTYNASDYLSFQYWNGSAWVEAQRWSGASSVWQQLSYTLTGFSTFQFRFIFFSNSVSTQEGAYIDDILLTGVPPAGAIAPVEPMAVIPQDEVSEELAGEESTSGVSLPGVVAAPAARVDLVVTPNPVAAATTIRFSLPAASAGSLAIFAADGRRVATLASGALTAGEHAIAWDGRDREGHPSAPGVYFARLETSGAEAVTQRLVVSR